MATYVSGSGDPFAAGGITRSSTSDLFPASVPGYVVLTATDTYFRIGTVFDDPGGTTTRSISYFGSGFSYTNGIPTGGVYTTVSSDLSFISSQSFDFDFFSHYGSLSDVSAPLADFANPDTPALLFSGNDSLTGGLLFQGADMHGGAGDDSFYNPVPDTNYYPALGVSMYGEAGNDLFYLREDGGNFASYGNLADGGDGEDRILLTDFMFGAIVQFDGADGSVSGTNTNTQSLVSIEAVSGSAFADTITATGAAVNQKFFGGGGGDTILAGDGNDILNGGTGFDVLKGEGGDDTFVTGLGADLDAVYGGDGFDTVYLAGIGVTLDLAAIAAPTATSGGFSLIEKFVGSSGADTMTGDGGDNALAGGAGIDTLTGLGGNDTLDGGLGNDILRGGFGHDTYVVGSTGDSVLELAGQGYDTVRTTLNAYTLGGNVERLYFDGAGNFTGTGNALSNKIYGGAGNDTFVMDGGGADSYAGYGGQDTVDFRALGAAIINFVTPALNAGSAAGETFSGIDRVLGSNTGNDDMTAGNIPAIFSGFGGNDTLRGGLANDTLTGGTGRDTLYGNDGMDVLNGGVGNDGLTGGAAADTFLYAAAGYGHDTVFDFQDGLDSLKFNSSVANDIGDFLIDGQGTGTVTMTLIGSADMITLRGAGPITITNADFVFY